jgi:hypothetical protein
MDAEQALLANIHHHLPELEALLAEVQDPLTYEDRTKMAMTSLTLARS